MRDILIIHSLGRHVVHFKFSNINRHFVVHEDLICSHSTLLKKRFQKHRKAVTGECSICHEDLDPEEDDITFCRSTCGQNLHEQCIEKWKTANPGPPTCPMCREPWTVRTTKVEDLCEELDQDAIQLYIDWLYTGSLRSSFKQDKPDEGNQLAFLKAWTVADTLKDRDFRDAIMVEYLSQFANGECLNFWTDSVGYVSYMQSNKEMKQFLAEAMLIGIDKDWFQDSSDDFPDDFTKAVGRAALAHMRVGVTISTLVEKYTTGVYWVL
jgi:hypothetical protein